MSPMDELNKITDQVPLLVLQDIHRRITDWLAAGGNHDDPYIEQQLKFAKRFVKE